MPTLSEALGRLRPLGQGAVRSHLQASSRLLVVTLDNQGVRNALSGRMMAQLHDLLVDLGRVDASGRPTQDLRAVIVRGAGHSYCAGADLSSIPPDAIHGPAMWTVMHDVTTRLRGLPFPTVGLIEGHAIGGGAEMMTAPDLRVWERKAKARFVQTTMGVTTGWGGASRLRDLVGRARAMRLLFGNEVVDVTKATEWGLADAVFEEPTVVAHKGSAVGGGGAEELSLAAEHAIVGLVGDGDVLVRANMKRSVDSPAAAEKDLFVPLWGGSANLEAIERVKRKGK